MKKYVSAIALRATLLAALLVCANTSTATAQTVPSPWAASDIGAPTLSGSATYSSGVFTITGAGTDIYGSSDQFMFVYQAVSGDVDIIAKVSSLDGSNSYAKAGVMIRKSLSANSAHSFPHATKGAGVRLLRRLSDGGSSEALGATTTAVPVWVRAKRVGTQVTSYWSSNGSTWTTIATDSIALGTSAYVGIAVNGRDQSYRATAVVSNVTVTGGQSTSGALPAGQQSSDIGSPAVAGSATYSSGTYTVKAGGTDIWGTADQFHYVYQPVTGNVEVIARVASITKTNRWAKAGVMVRESLAADARHAMVVTSISKGYAFQRRPDPGADTVHTSGGSGGPPGWVKLVRSGDLFEAYRSADGVSWTKIGSDTIPMSDTVYVGLAATSRNATTATTVLNDNVKITAAASANQSPAVSVTSPASGTSVTLPTTLTITASASDPENRMNCVDFYAGSTLILRDTTAPYSANWAPAAAGTYALKAVAYDSDGGSSTSSSVNVTVNPAGNSAPSVSLSSPAAGASFTAPATVTVSATASDPENALARVEFFAGTTRIATVTTAPYSFSWTNVAAGTYSLTAVAYDAAGASATSAARSITVSTVLSPPKTVVFAASADHATNVTKYVLKIYAATANPATATPIATSDMGKPTPASNGDITVDRATFFSGLATGTYLATVTAVGASGQTQSDSISFTR